MKKLFTSLLLLGAVTVTQAQVTVTGYDATEKTVTINFKYDGARPTTDKVNDAINAAFGKLNNPGQQPEFISDGTYANLKPHQRKDIKTVILTGDWNNVDIDNTSYAGYGKLGNGSIAEIVGVFADGEHPVTLDLSACQGFESKYVDVRDYYGAQDPYNPNVTIPKTGYAEGYTTEKLETDFTTLPEFQAGGTQMKDFTSTVTVTPNQSSVVTVKTVGHLYHAGGPEITITTNPDGTLSWSPNPLPDGLYKIVKDGNGYNAVSEDGYTVQPVGYLTTIYTFEVNGNIVELTEDKIDQSSLRTVDGVLYYDYTLYEYEDENGSVVTTSTTAPHQLQGDANSGYTYTYQKSVTVDPVLKFSIDKELRIEGIIFPVSNNFTFIPNELFKDQTTLKKAVLSSNIVAIGNKAFGGATALQEINFPTSLEEIGYAAFKKTKLTSANLAPCTKLSRIRFETFQECFSLTEATFPSSIREIQKEAYEKCALVEVDLSQCHALRRLAADCFNDMKGADGECSLLDVKLCSHEKVIRGTSQKNSGDSHGAFHLDKKIKRVEVVGCENTCVTECVCENRAFEWDITHYQTAAPSNVYDKVAELIYPNNLPACEGSGYTSSFDFFEGDYKAGTMITQETLLCYYRQIPNTGSGSGKFVWLEPDPNNPDQMVKKEETRTVTADDRYIGNGWLEFIKTGSTTVVPKGEFLRTYSRTAGDGPCMLPNDITAYRAVDYKSNLMGWVLDRNRKTGTHYLKEGATDLTADESFELITPETDPAEYANRPLYSKVTTSGKLYLRPLVAKQANMNYGGKTIAYDDEEFEVEVNGETQTMTHKEWYDSEAIYSQLANVPGGYSYVPEETGVVLYSRSLLEEAFLVLGGDFGTETVYKKFPHTGDRYEEGRLTSSNTDNDINMLSGSFGTGVPVAPVFPWVYKDKKKYSGGHYTDNKEYRNFAVVKIEENGGSVIEDRYRWKRLTPSKMKVNRAFAQIPVNRFDNWNESVDQMPDFTIEDEVQTENGANMMLLSIFGDEELNGETDGIEEIVTAGTAVGKTNDDAWYTIQGVRVAQPTKGVYIHNGKKVVIN